MEEQGRSSYREEPSEAAPRTFLGYPPPTSSTTYTPNQLFDVVLPNASRGCLRLVAYIVRKTLGWSDEEGNPQNPHVYVTYRELIERAGISRGAIKGAIEEAITNKYIDCLRLGQSHKAGEEGFSAMYSLRWDERESYVTDPREFDGFFAGNGNLTHIPNDFFDYTIPSEPLAVVRVVGVIIRHTIGWQTRFGMRRQQVAMSFTEIMRRTSIQSRSTVNEALKSALSGNHVVRAVDGVFHPHDPMAATYSIRWSDASSEGRFEPDSENGSKIEPGNRRRFKNRTRESKTVQKSNQPIGSKIEPADGSKIEPETVQKSNRQAFKNRTTIETTHRNNTPKQHQTGDAAGKAGSLALLVGELVAFGIGNVRAQSLVAAYPEDRIRRQLVCIDARKARSSRTGLLIRCIEEDIPAPDVQTSEQGRAQVFAAHFYAELAGNPSEPAASPSASDREAAELIVARFLHETPDKAGRDFARHTQSRDEKSRSPIRTLPLAARLFGDSYVAANEARKTAKRAEEEAKATEERDSRVAGLYGAFVAETAGRLEEASAEIAEGFAAYVAAKQVSRARLSTRASDMLRQSLADPSARAALLAEYIQERFPGLIPGAKEWRDTISSNHFQEERQHA